MWLVVLEGSKTYVLYSYEDKCQKLCKTWFKITNYDMDVNALAKCRKKKFWRRNSLGLDDEVLFMLIAYIINKPSNPSITELVQTTKFSNMVD